MSRRTSKTLKSQPKEGEWITVKHKKVETRLQCLRPNRIRPLPEIDIEANFKAKKQTQITSFLCKDKENVPSTSEKDILCAPTACINPSRTCDKKELKISQVEIPLKNVCDTRPLVQFPSPSRKDHFKSKGPTNDRPECLQQICTSAKYFDIGRTCQSILGAPRELAVNTPPGQSCKPVGSFKRAASDASAKICTQDVTSCAVESYRSVVERGQNLRTGKSACFPVCKDGVRKNSDGNVKESNNCVITPSSVELNDGLNTQSKRDQHTRLSPYGFRKIMLEKEGVTVSSVNKTQLSAKLATYLMEDIDEDLEDKSSFPATLEDLDESDLKVVPFVARDFDPNFTLEFATEIEEDTSYLNLRNPSVSNHQSTADSDDRQDFTDAYYRRKYDTHEYGNCHLSSCSRPHTEDSSTVGDDVNSNDSAVVDFDNKGNEASDYLLHNSNPSLFLRKQTASSSTPVLFERRSPRKKRFKTSERQYSSNKDSLAIIEFVETEALQPFYACKEDSQFTLSTQASLGN